MLELVLVDVFRCASFIVFKESFSFSQVSEVASLCNVTRAKFNFPVCTRVIEKTLVHRLSLSVVQ